MEVFVRDFDIDRVMISEPEMRGGVKRCTAKYMSSDKEPMDLYLGCDPGCYPKIISIKNSVFKGIKQENKHILTVSIDKTNKSQEELFNCIWAIIEEIVEKEKGKKINVPIAASKDRKRGNEVLLFFNLMEGPDGIATKFIENNGNRITEDPKKIGKFKGKIMFTISYPVMGKDTVNVKLSLSQVLKKESIEYYSSLIENEDQEETF